MRKHKSIKEQLIATTQSSKVATEERLNKLDLNERINRAEAIVRSDRIKKTTNHKAVRDAFTMLQSDIKAIKEIKQKCQLAGIDVHKSLIVRAGIKALANMPIEELHQIISDLPKIKVGRPKDESL
jgi:hypothetical protein